MAEPQAPVTPESIKSEVAALDASPYGVGESQSDREAKREAIYKKAYPPENPETAAPKPDDAAKQGDAKGDAPAAPLAVDWGDPDGAEALSESDTMLRSSMQGYFGEVGFTGEQATALVGIARRAAYAATPMTDEEWHAKEIETEKTLRKEWGKNYDRNLAKAYAMADAFESRFAHDDLKKAIDNGLWIDAIVLRTLGTVASAQNGVRADIHKMRAELLKTNQGSPRYKELTTAIERHYKALHGGK